VAPRHGNRRVLVEGSIILEVLWHFTWLTSFAGSGLPDSDRTGCSLAGWAFTTELGMTAFRRALGSGKRTPDRS
jgi:hypothetical protein